MKVKNMKKYQIIFVAIIVQLFGLSLSAQQNQLRYDSEADSLFYMGIAKYNNILYDNALRDFREIIARPFNQKTTTSLYMIGRCLNKRGEYLESVFFVKDFIENYPHSEYKDDAQYLLAENYYQLGRPKYFLRELLLIYTNTDDERLKEKAASKINDFYDDNLTIKDIEDLKFEFDDREIKALLDLKSAVKDIESGNYIEAIPRVDFFLNNYQRSLLRESALHLAEIIENKKSSKLKIGALLPLQGYLSELGQSLLMGAEFAVREYNSFSPDKIELVVKEGMNSSLDLLNVIKELGDNPNIIGIFGPVDDYNTLLAGIMLDRLAIPMIAPMASMNNLYKTSDYIFQSHADLANSGKMLARYAVERLGLKTFAIISPANSNGIEISDHFASEVDKRGGQILYEDWYFQGTDNFGRYFEKIRNIGLDIMMNDTVFVYADSLFGNDTTYNILMERADSIYIEEMYLRSITDSTIYLSEGDSVLQKVIKDSLKQIYMDSLSLRELDFWKKTFIDRRIAQMEEEGILEIDSLDIPVTSIDAIFLPAEKEDLIYLVPQLAFYNFRTQILGGINWFDEEILGRHSTHLNGMIFLSDSYLKSANEDFIKFRDSFRMEIGKNPDRLRVLGYDSMNLIIKAIKNGARTRKELQKKLSEINYHRGIGGDIIFNEGERVNSYINILQLRNGIIRKVN